MYQSNNDTYTKNNLTHSPSTKIKLVKLEVKTPLFDLTSAKKPPLFKKPKRNSGRMVWKQAYQH